MPFAGFASAASYDAEHELCFVHIGRCGEKIKINSDEILDWRWISPEALQREIAWGDHRPAGVSLLR
jgi:isopentenyldiphosphate isomerase